MPALPMPQASADHARLEACLKALASTTRLLLIALLREPRTLDEIAFAPGPAQAGESPGRPISRQAVQNHLDQLADLGLVRVGITERKGKRPMHEYVVDHSRVFLVLEELRRVAAVPPARELDPLRTVDADEDAAPAWPDGPKLVVAHGVREGRAFPLRLGDTSPPRGWIVGRSAAAAVCIDYDPFVSSENAEVLRGAAGWRLLDLRSARNRVALNWRRLTVGEEAALRHGDVIGVGRSLLLFRES